MFSAFPFADPAKVQEAQGVIGSGRLGQTEVMLYKQLLVAFAATGEPLPPSVAPSLMSTVELGSYDVDLFWTPSNRNAQYKVYTSNNGVTFDLSETTSATSTTYPAGEEPATWYFYVVPFNTVGEGPSSNTVSEAVPGESETQFLLLEDGTEMLLEDDTEILLEAA